MADSIYRGRFQQDELAQRLRPVVNPNRAGGEPPTWRDEAAEATIRLAVARAHAISKLADIPDEVFAVARASHLFAIVMYSNNWPALSQMPHVGSWYEEPTLDMAVNEACSQMLSHLGLLLMGGSPVVLPPGEYRANLGVLEITVTDE